MPTTPGPTPTPGGGGAETNKPLVTVYAAQPASIYDVSGCGATTSLIQAKVVDESSLWEVAVYWRTRDGGPTAPVTAYQQLPMAYNSGIDRWEATLDAPVFVNPSGRLEYYIWVVDQHGNSTRQPGGFYFSLPVTKCV